MDFHVEEPSVQHGNLVSEQLRQQQGEEARASLTYWEQQLKGASLLLDLPTDRPRLPTMNWAREHHSFVLSQPLSTALNALRSQEDVSLFTTLLAAFQILLHRYSGQDDLLVGTPHMESTAAGSGYANFLVLRATISGNPPFREWLKQVHQAVEEAQAHGQVPFEQLVQALQPEREPSRHPLFQVIFALQPAPLQVHEENEQYLHSLNMQVGTGTTKVDLMLTMQETTQGLRGWVEYNSELFDAATIERLVGHWQRLLEDIVTEPNRRTAELRLLLEDEWQRQVVEWNATQTTYPQDQCLHELFEEQVERTPEAIAVVFGQEQSTYRELNQRANQLAHYLQNVGVMPETLVALLIERSIDFVAAILAVFKAGGAFLPLDPQYPAKRHYEILQQSHCHYALTTDKYRSTLTEALEEFDVDQRPQVIRIESLFQEEEAKENLPPQSKPGNLAYVMYTSGSTGVPKGVMVEQRGMINHIYAKIADLDLSMEDRVAQNSPPCFDIVVWQCLAALLLGGCVHIFSDEIAHNPLQLLRQTDEQKITILQVVPSLLRAAVQQAEMLAEARPRLRDLRWIVPTGDALSPELCRQWLQLYPAIPMLNNCGSTECSDDNCHYAIYQPPPLDYPLPIMPIGWPIQNICAYILDQQLMPVPIGVVGDLYIGGIGVGRGYLNDARRTAEVFLPDPFSQEPGARLYKTRDRARYLPDGLIEFLGRSDNLIKIRGLRIEPGEVEAVLERNPAIRETVVLAREITSDNKYLVAYIVPAKDQAPSSEELRTWLKDKLPEYMIPPIFVLMEAMPLNSNGKIDRRALPAPDQARPELQPTFVKARTPLEEAIAGIWSQVLEIEQVGIHDNFFALGGHSLLAMQVLSRLRATFQVEVPLHSFLEAPTVAQLAELLQQYQASDVKAHKPPLRSISREAYRVHSAKGSTM